MFATDPFLEECIKNHILSFVYNRTEKNRQRHCYRRLSAIDKKEQAHEWIVSLLLQMVGKGDLFHLLSGSGVDATVADDVEEAIAHLLARIGHW